MAWKDTVGSISGDSDCGNPWFLHILQHGGGSECAGVECGRQGRPQADEKRGGQRLCDNADIGHMLIATVYICRLGCDTLFSHDSEVISVAVSLIVPLVLYQYGDATQINYANALRGTANVMPMLWIAFVSYVVVGVPATYLLAFPAGLGIYGIILSFSISLFLAAGLFLWFFMRSTRS